MIRDHPDFAFVASGAGADFVIRRVGADAGKVMDFAGAGPPARGQSPSSNYFIQVTGDDPQVVRDAFERASEEIRGRLRGSYPSISKPELVLAYMEAWRV